MSDKPTSRIEITGNIVVHHEIKPTVHAVSAEFKVACA